MTWEETIEYIRTEPSFYQLIEDAYFNKNLTSNVERFRQSDEYKETLSYLKKYANKFTKILDIGSGNGISAISFALDGYDVTSTEPDKSVTVGSGAIKLLKAYYNLQNLSIFEYFAENMHFESGSFDIVYIRQAMHHAQDLNKFIAACYNALKPGGILFTARDHVVFNKADKECFLNSHPLQKFYGGENAYTAVEYKKAMTNAGFKVILELKYFDSIINYSPMTTSEITRRKKEFYENLQLSLANRIGFLAYFPQIIQLYLLINRSLSPLNERNVAGRMYSYLAKKL